MMRLLIKNGQKVIVSGSKTLAKQYAPHMLELSAKVTSDILEKQKNRVKIPNLRDVQLEDALDVLKDGLGLIPLTSIVKPDAKYADECPNLVINCLPKFGSKVEPRTTIKVFYITEEVITKSQELRKNQLLQQKTPKLKVPGVIGLPVEHALEDFEALGLKVTLKLEKANIKLANKEAGEVTRFTHPNGSGVGSTYKTGERVCLFYVDEHVIAESINLKAEKEHEQHEKFEKISSATKGFTQGIYSNVTDLAQSAASKVSDTVKLGKKK